MVDASAFPSNPVWGIIQLKAVEGAQNMSQKDQLSSGFQPSVLIFLTP